MERPIRPKYTSTVILCGDNLVNNSQNNKTPKWFIGRKRQNKRQQALLVETLLADLNVARGNASEKTTLNLWTALTKRLNTMGCSRTVEEWQNVWKKWHEKVSGKYRRICLQERHPLARGGPATKEKLNEIEMKILDIVGRPSIDELRTTVIEQGRTFVKDQGRTAVEEQADVEDPLDAPPAAVCRVCLTGDRKTYRVNMALERTYDAITGFKLQRAGRPTALCCVCVSQLRRCRRFIDTARESNAALDRWYQNRAYADFKLKERPLFSFTKTTTAKLGVTFRLSPIVWEPKVKQEKKETVIEIERQNDQGTFMMDEIKHEIIDNDELNTLDDDQKYTQMSDDYNKNDKASDDGIDRLNDEKETHLSDNDDEIDYTDRRIVETDDSDDFEWAMDSDKNKVWDYVQLYVPKAGDEGVGTVASTSRGDNFQSVTDIVAQDSTTVAQDPAIVSQDFGIVAQDPAIAAQDPAIVAQDSAVVTQNPAIVAQDSNIVARNSAIIAQDSAIVAQDSAIVSRSPELAKRIKLEEDATNAPGIKQWRPILPRHRPVTYTTKIITVQRRNSTKHTEEKQFACDKCDYKSNLKRLLKRHLISHSSEKPFACDQCDYKTVYKWVLKQHSLIHTDEARFICDKCDYKTKSKYSLMKHLLTHTGEKTFTCNKCDYKSYTKSNLTRHFFFHTNEKSFGCDKCDYKCKLKMELKRHSLSHNSNKPFICEICGYKTKTKHQLNRHSLIHRSEMFACDHCNYRCRYKTSLKKHLSTCCKS